MGTGGWDEYGQELAGYGCGQECECDEYEQECKGSACRQEFAGDAQGRVVQAIRVYGGGGYCESYDDAQGKPDHRRALGRRGEGAAAKYLENMGYQILDRNWRCKFGEADIVAHDCGALVFVEVKTRTSIEQGFPEESVTSKRRARYERIAACYLSKHRFVNCRLRFDVIGILVIDDDDEEGRAMLRHNINAFGSQ